MKRHYIVEAGYRGWVWSALSAICWFVLGVFAQPYVLESIAYLRRLL